MSDYLKDLRKKMGKYPLLIPHSVVVVFNENNEVLLEIRQDDGYFDFPGGGIELKESGEETACRELLEETGLVALDYYLFKVYTGEITYYKYKNGDEIYGVDLVYICTKYSGELKPQKEEVKSLVFCRLEDIPLEKMSLRNKAIIKDILNK